MNPSMMFFTPELYRAVQRDPEQAMPIWQRALDGYAASVAGIRLTLPPLLLEVAEGNDFHDAVIEAAKLDDGALVVVLRAPGDDVDERFRLKFSGVTDVTVRYIGTIRAPDSQPLELRSIVGGEWLYDEVRCVDGAFEYHFMIGLSHVRLGLAAVRFEGFEYVSLGRASS